MRVVKRKQSRCDAQQHQERHPASGTVARRRQRPSVVHQFSTSPCWPTCPPPSRAPRPLRAPSGLEALIDGFEFEVGKQYLITAADGNVNYCGYSGIATPELTAAFSDAFER